MNWHYISGFFDADGCITVVTPNKGKNKTIQLSFHNNEKEILDSIRNFIEKELDIRGSLSCKKAKKDTHQNSYDLKYSFRQGWLVANKLISIHPKKVHRITIYNKIQNSTKRNGKYSNKELEYRKQLLEQFFQN